MIFQVIMLVDRNILTMMIVEVRADLGLNDFEVSLFQGLAFTSLYCLAGLVAGGAADRYPAKWLIYISVTLCTLAATVLGVVKAYWGMVVARMAMGAGQGAINPPAQVLISSMFPKERVSLPMSLFSVAGAIGIGASYFGGGLLLEATTRRSVPGLEAFAPWRQVLILTATPGVLVALLSFTLLNPRGQQKLPATGQSDWRAFRRFLTAERDLFTRLAIGYGLITVVNYAVFSWAPTYARRVLGMTPSEIGTEMGLIATLGTTIAGAMYGYIVDREFSRGRTAFILESFTVGAVIAIPACVLGFTLDDRIAFVGALLAVQCILAGSLGPGIAAIQMVTPPDMRGKMGALIIIVVNFIGYALGPMLVGALTDFIFTDAQKVGWSIALAILVLAPISAVAVWSARPHFVSRVSRTTA